MHKRVMLSAVAVLIALTTIAALVTPALAVRQRLRLRQTRGVTATGTVSFTYNGQVVGGPYAVACTSSQADYTFTDLTRKPNDISWNIQITWSDGQQENWQGNNQPWPQTYRKTHQSSYNELVFEDPEVGGFAIPVNKLGLLAPYFGFTATLAAAAVATAVYVRRIKSRK